jgi:hypothetical protein
MTTPNELVTAAILYQHHIQVLELVDTEQPLSSMKIEVPGLLDDEAPTIHIVRVGQSHYHAGVKPTAHYFFTKYLSRMMLPLHSYSSYR